jgi:hypothetical protein
VHLGIALDQRENEIGATKIGATIIGQAFNGGYIATKARLLSSTGGDRATGLTICRHGFSTEPD